MKPNLPLDFTLNKETKTVHVKREFAADVNLVWAAWTQPELLDKWWAPKPYQAKTKSMDFTEGGTWFYAMVGPEGDTHNCRLDYETINPKQKYAGLDAFCDENGTINTDFPRSHWTNSFTENGDTTTVNIQIQYQSVEDMEKIMSLGFKEGFTMAMENLDQFIEAKFRLQSELRTDSMPRVCSYLNFPGNTEEAFLFYRSVFKTEFNGNGFQRFGDLPPDTNHPPVSDSIKKMILHIELPTIGNHVLKGTDAPKEMGFTLIRGNNMHISLEPESREETRRLFETLSSEGVVDMELQDMFFGAYFGSCTDKYGINWMFNYAEKSNNQ